MDKVEEAREALAKRVLHDVVGGFGSNQQLDLLAAADAYGAARELKGHVDACVMKEWFAPGPDSGAWHDCGDDWYCDKAEAIRAQGKLRL